MQCRRSFEEKSKTTMFVTISTYRARAGEEDAIIALHEEWQRNNQESRTSGYFSAELLRSIKDSREFIALMHFESQEAAQLLANDPVQNAWQRRLISLTESASLLTGYTSEWHIVPFVRGVA